MSEPLPDFDGLLDWPRLQEWVASQPALPGDGPVTAVEQLTGGSQNNIFLLTRGEGERMVLRRPPRHLRKNSNDTMLREARVLGAIAGSGVPHPEFFAACADTDVIGVCFYVMGAIDGFTPMGPLPGSYGTDVEWRRTLSFELVEGAAAPGRGRRERGRAVGFRQGRELVGAPGVAVAFTARRLLAARGLRRVRAPGCRPGRRLARGEPAGGLPHRHHPRRLPVRQRDVRSPTHPSSRRSSTGSCRHSAIRCSTSVGC